jgi:hypothetical protein
LQLVYEQFFVCLRLVENIGAFSSTGASVTGAVAIIASAFTLSKTSATISLILANAAVKQLLYHKKPHQIHSQQVCIAILRFAY